FMDPEAGLSYVRLQTWFPFTVYVGMNGREWLARQMDKAGLGYQRRDNCFSWIEDWARAQQLLDEQGRRWREKLATAAQRRGGYSSACPNQPGCQRALRGSLGECGGKPFVGGVDPRRVPASRVA